MPSYNCSACGETHNSMADIQACHAAKKQASSIDTMSAAVAAENKVTEEPKEQEATAEQKPVVAKYRKLPVVIEAYQAKEELQIETLEGTMTANPGDWIIKGVNGELYPCKPDIFAKTYEPVREGDFIPAPTDDRGKVIILREHLPERIRDAAKYMSIGQYGSLLLLGVLREKGFVIEEGEMGR